MKIAIVSNKKILQTTDITEKIENELKNSGLDYDTLDVNNLKSGYDFVCSAGGDGTILKTSRYYAKTATPVMGINSGRLGFLSLITPEEVYMLGDIIKNSKYEIQERIMLKTKGCTALNDFVIKGHSPNRSAKFNLYINDRLVSDYIADGLIISTPTGSTAYGLSAGGPILVPGLKSFVIVPICAHTMTARPLVVPDSEKITVKSVDEYLDVSCDGQETIVKVKEIGIELSEYRAKLAFPVGDNFYSILRNKLNWGVSPVSQNV
ncbi:MAG: NAD(+)/NADH kinase [Candidatus Gastranaerophilales bacterium]|nr:NAD(+)/NADH kinase [Candidatus Gastranaerophilales bacterium]